MKKIAFICTTKDRAVFCSKTINIIEDVDMKYYQIDPQVQQIVRETVESGDTEVNADTLSRIVYLKQNRDTEFTQPMSAEELLKQLGLSN